MHIVRRIAGPAMLIAVMSFAMIGGCCKSERPSSSSSNATTDSPNPLPAKAEPPATRHVKVIISGHVQGVGFRAFTASEARKLGLGGWVLNLPDGRVQAEIEGPTDKVAELLKLLGKGPPAARADRVEVEELPVGGGFTTFRVDD